MGNMWGKNLEEQPSLGREREMANLKTFGVRHFLLEFCDLLVKTIRSSMFFHKVPVHHVAIFCYMYGCKEDETARELLKIDLVKT